MHKLIRIIVINLFIFFILLIAIDYTIFKIDCYKEIRDYGDIILWVKIPPYSLKMDSTHSVYSSKGLNNFITIKSTTPLKGKSIIVFGGSFAYGFLLDPYKQSLSAKLSNITGRTVYNRAVSGWGVQHMLYQLNRDDFYKQVESPEYVIYVFMSDHIRRILTPIAMPFEREIYLRYKKKNSKLAEISPRFKFIRGLYIVRKLQDLYVKKVLLSEKNREKNFDFMKLHFEESKRLVESKYQKTKFVILIYKDEYYDWYLNTKRWDELRQQGFTVIDVNALTNRDMTSLEYQLPDGHPNAKAWEVITPALVKELKL